MDLQVLDGGPLLVVGDLGGAFELLELLLHVHHQLVLLRDQGRETELHQILRVQSGLFSLLVRGYAVLGLCLTEYVDIGSILEDLLSLVHLRLLFEFLFALNSFLHHWQLLLVLDLLQSVCLCIFIVETGPGGDQGFLQLLWLPRLSEVRPSSEGIHPFFHNLGLF